MIRLTISKMLTQSLRLLVVAGIYHLDLALHLRHLNINISQY